MKLTFYSRQDCPLCDAGYLVVDRLATHHGFKVDKIDVDTDPALAERHGERVPVVEHEGSVVAWGKISGPDLERTLGIGTVRADRPRGNDRQPRHRERAHAAGLGLAALVGAAAGTIGGTFRMAVQLVTEGRSLLVDAAALLPYGAWVAAAAVSAVMTLAAVALVRRFAAEAGGSGVQEIEGALDGVRPVRWRRVLPVKFVGGVLALGSGLVLGREGPTIQMGGNVAKMIGDGLRRSEEDIHVLIAAGAGAGLAAAFNAPLAGLLFVVEEMRPQFRFNVGSFLSVLVACAVSDIVVRMMLGGANAIEMPSFPAPATTSLWLFLPFGALMGVVGTAFNSALFLTLDAFARLTRYRLAIVVGVLGAAAGLLLTAYPDVVGGGYRVTGEALMTGPAPAMLLMLFFVRFVTTILSFALGAPGGIFAPMIALGTLLGVWCGQLSQDLLPGAIANPQIFAVVGMGALFSAIVGAPITGIILAIEMTGNYQQILPLMVSCAAAVFVANTLGARPVYSVLLERTLGRSGTGTESTG